MCLLDLVVDDPDTVTTKARVGRNGKWQQTSLRQGNEVTRRAGTDTARTTSAKGSLMTKGLAPMSNDDL
jgi:hypothetical protein